MKNKLHILVIFIGVISMFGCDQSVNYEVFGGIYGVVTDIETHEPIRGVNVVLSPTNLSTVTGADGSYVFSNLDAQQYKLTASANGYQYNSRQVTVLPGQNIPGDINLLAKAEVDGFSLSKKALLFGDSYSELMLTITNTGNSSETKWNISNVNEDWLTVSPMSGTIAIGKSSSIKVLIDRSYINEDVMTYFMVNAGGGSEEVLVTATKSSSGGGNGSDVEDALSVSATSLDFGEDKNQMNFTITNLGTEDFDFEIWLNKPEWLQFGWEEQMVESNSSETVTVYVDREKLFGLGEVTIEIRTAVGSKYIDISAYEPIDYGTCESPDRSIDAWVTSVETVGSTVYIDIKFVNNSENTYNAFDVGNCDGVEMYAIDNLSNTYYSNNSKITIKANDGKAESHISVMLPGNGASINCEVAIKDVDDTASALKTLVVGTAALRFGNLLEDNKTIFHNIPIIR